MVKVNRDRNTKLLIPDVTEGPLVGRKFTRFAGAIGWPDPKGEQHFAKHWLFVCAQRESGQFVAFEEHSGHLREVIDAAISAKDRLFMDTIWLDETPVMEHAIRLLRSTDGLTEYRQHKNLKGDWIYTHDHTHWQDFRDYDTIANVIGVDDDIKVSLEYGLQLIINLQAEHKFQPMRSCLVTQSLLLSRPPIDDILTHPLLKAMVWTVLMMHGYEPVAQTHTTQLREPYPNMRPR